MGSLSQGSGMSSTLLSSTAIAVSDVGSRDGVDNFSSHSSIFSSTAIAVSAVDSIIVAGSRGGVGNTSSASS